MSKNMNSVNFGEVVVRRDGRIDREATLEAIGVKLDNYIQLQEGDLDKLGEAVANFFVEHPGTTVKTPALIAVAVNKVGSTPDTYQAMTERAAAAIKANDRLYVVKGSGGGIRYMSDAEYASFKSDGLNPAQRKRAEKEAQA